MAPADKQVVDVGQFLTTSISSNLPLSIAHELSCSSLSHFPTIDSLTIMAHDHLKSHDAIWVCGYLLPTQAMEHLVSLWVSSTLLEQVAPGRPWLSSMHPGQVAICLVLIPVCWGDHENFVLHSIHSLHLEHHIYWLDLSVIEFSLAIDDVWLRTRVKEPVSLLNFFLYFTSFLLVYLLFLQIIFPIFCLLLSRGYFDLYLFLGCKLKLFIGSLDCFLCRHLLF